MLLLRGVQAVREWLGRDPVSQGLVAYVPAVAIVLGFTVVGGVVLRLARRRGTRPVVSELGDELGSVGFAIAAALIVLHAAGSRCLLAVVQTVASLRPAGGGGASSGVDPGGPGRDAGRPVRILIGVVLIVLAVRSTPRAAGQPGRWCWAASA